MSVADYDGAKHTDMELFTIKGGFSLLMPDTAPRLYVAVCVYTSYICVYCGVWSMAHRML